MRRLGEDAKGSSTRPPDRAPVRGHLVKDCPARLHVGCTALEDWLPPSIPDNSRLTCMIQSTLRDVDQGLDPTQALRMGKAWPRLPQSCLSHSLQARVTLCRPGTRACCSWQITRDRGPSHSLFGVAFESIHSRTRSRAGRQLRIEPSIKTMTLPWRKGER
jgi:hypothetical protein